VSTRLHQLQVARLSPTLLGEAAELVASFIESTHAPPGSGGAVSGGGFADRAGKCDLYYTVFAVEGLLALQRDLPVDALRGYLRSFGDGAGLDLIHLGCLARVWAAIKCDGLDDATRCAIVDRVARFRSDDGGFNQDAGEARGTSYAGFIGYAAYEDLGATLHDADRLVSSVESLRDTSGGYWLDADSAVPTTPTTAAAVTLLHQLGASCDTTTGEYLLGQFNQGGFVAAPQTPMPDLLSTAVALHALATLHVDAPGIKEPCLDFVDTLWTSRGGFLGSWQDDVLDTEYTFYGLLALGHLSVI